MADKKTSQSSTLQRIFRRVKVDNENGARKSIIEDLFYDFNRSKSEVFLMNFFRGLFFGIGSVVGGAAIILVSAVVLGLFVDLPGGIGEFVQRVIDAMNRTR